MRCCLGCANRVRGAVVSDCLKPNQYQTPLHKKNGLDSMRHQRPVHIKKAPPPPPAGNILCVRPVRPTSPDPGRAARIGRAEPCRGGIDMHRARAHRGCLRGHTNLHLEFNLCMLPRLTHELQRERPQDACAVRVNRSGRSTGLSWFGLLCRSLLCFPSPRFFWSSSCALVPC